MLVWVPTPIDHAAATMGGVPEGVTLEHWDGRFPLPASAAEVTWLVPSPMYGGTDTVAALGMLPSLQVVQVLNAGYDLYADALPEGVTLCNAGDANAAAVADWVMAVVLADVRRLDVLAAQQREHRWQLQFGPSMASRRVLVLGYGAIGRALGRRLAAFDCTVVPVASRPRPDEGVRGVDELADLASSADVLVVLTPLTPATRGLVDAAVLAALPDGALLVNAARGPVVDTDALLSELRSGRLRAALDVTDPEPLPPDHPLWDTPGVRITPHVAGATSEFFAFTYPVVRQQLERALRGEPLANVVVPAR